MGTTSKELKVRKTVSIKVAAPRVWEALTQSEWTRQYFFGCDIVSDWCVGSPIVYKIVKDGLETIPVKGKIISIEHDKYVEYTVWSPEAGLADIESNYSKVTYNLSFKDGSTELTVCQENFGGDKKRYLDSSQGWDFVLSGLKKLLEG